MLYTKENELNQIKVDKDDLLQITEDLKRVNVTERFYQKNKEIKKEILFNYNICSFYVLLLSVRFNFN